MPIQATTADNTPARAASVRERPILFSGPMVRAILDGSKTQTRRVVKGIALDWLAPDVFSPAFVALPENGLSPYGFAGDRLWVRETWAMRPDTEAGSEKALHYLRLAADGGDLRDEWHEYDRWRPSIHMPHWACRLVLEITDVRVERLQSISDTDAEAEGLTKRGYWWDVGAAWEGDGIAEHPVDTYRTLWDSLNAKRGYGWDANPWVWVLSFRRVDA